MHEVCGVMYVSSMKRQSLKAASIFEYKAFGARVMAAEQRNANLAATAAANEQYQDPRTLMTPEKLCLQVNERVL